MGDSLKRISDLKEYASILDVEFLELDSTMDILKIAVLEAFGDTHLPFLYEVLGRDKFLQVLDIFQDTEMMVCSDCGHVLKWPARDELSTIVRDFIIYCRLRKCKGRNKVNIIREMSKTFNMSTYEILKSKSSMEGRVDKYFN